MKYTEQELAANYMAAFSHLVGGSAGRHEEFIDKVELVLSPHEPHGFQLMQFAGKVRRIGRPVIWLHLDKEVPNVPRIGLVVLSGDQLFMIESCMLWTSPRGRRAQLVPDSFKMGAFEFDDQLQLRLLADAPTRSFRAGERGIVRACRRLRQIERDQLIRGDVFPLPQLAKAA